MASLHNRLYEPSLGVSIVAIAGVSRFPGSRRATLWGLATW